MDNKTTVADCKRQCLYDLLGELIDLGISGAIGDWLDTVYVVGCAGVDEVGLPYSDMGEELVNGAPMRFVCLDGFEKSLTMDDFVSACRHCVAVWDSENRCSADYFSDENMSAVLYYAIYGQML